MVLDIVQCYGPCLCKLSLRLCSNISDRGLASIMDHCCELTHLDLMDNDHILGERLERIPEDLPKLRNLNIQYCKRIVESIIEDLERRKPNLFVSHFGINGYISCYE
ncbi:hypothetical protein DPMN_140306 [Dreissena polymorpha]|uniref:Uncharacterized protein n=1 Tax=Dreissena polymorpha TaxID=45954 RepID=A0A9D4GA78_DREPO|nr:hypothetical protein DPMN_140306 [Dreissena polymorpha]